MKQRLKKEYVNSMIESHILEHINYTYCDRITSEMRGMSPKIILGDSRRSENAQTHTYKHTISHMNFKLKLL
jgi:hypothetical protein